MVVSVGSPGSVTVGLEVVDVRIVEFEDVGVGVRLVG